MKLTNRKKISKGLCEISSRYWCVIPIGPIDDVLREQGYRLINEDFTDFEGFFLGSSSRATLQIAPIGVDKEENRVIVLSWYKMETGRYEINCYIS